MIRCQKQTDSDLNQEFILFFIGWNEFFLEIDFGTQVFVLLLNFEFTKTDLNLFYTIV